jgi:hypothetical protein
MTNKLTHQTIYALQNFCISSKSLLGPREEVIQIITRRLVKRGKKILASSEAS